MKKSLYVPLTIMATLVFGCKSKKENIEDDWTIQTDTNTKDTVQMIRHHSGNHYFPSYFFYHGRGYYSRGSYESIHSRTRGAGGRISSSSGYHGCTKIGVVRGGFGRSGHFSS